MIIGGRKQTSKYHGYIGMEKEIIKILMLCGLKESSHMEWLVRRVLLGQMFG